MKLTIILTDNFEEFFTKYAPNEDIEKVVGRVGFVHSDEEELYAVFCSKVTGSDIVHECVHLTNEVFKWTYTNFDIENDEPQAYLTAWFYEQIATFLDKYK